jgi:pimeloyl-ACP methyl ester carboxylesterase
LVLIFPGIEGRSFLNLAILQGLLDAGVPYGLEIVDWTTGNKFLALYHLRSRQRNERIAAEIASRIAQYQAEYPGRPVWIVGHSGGGGMALLTASRLPHEVRLRGVILLAAAVSPQFDLAALSTKSELGFWNFSSYLDWLFVGLGTTLLGSFDGRLGPSAGMLGFRAHAPVEEHPYALGLMKQFHLGGHFGCVNRVFICESVGPILLADTAARPS